MTCLKAHLPVATEGYARVSNKYGDTASAMTVQEILSFVEAEKKLMKPIEVDIKDGKRRLAAAKGPKKTHCGHHG